MDAGAGDDLKIDAGLSQGGVGFPEAFDAPEIRETRIVPYEGMCGGDLVLLPLWRKFFAEDAEETGRLSTAVHLCCHHLLTPRDFGEVGFATRSPVGDWVLYQSKMPYVPCDPLDQRKK